MVIDDIGDGGQWCYWELQVVVMDEESSDKR